MKKLSEVESITRRRFMIGAGGLAGAAALSTILSAEQPRENRIKDIDVNAIGSTVSQTEVLVIGSGIAGLFAAVKAHDAGAKVIMVSKGRLGSSGQTPFAKGIFAYDQSKE